MADEMYSAVTRSIRVTVEPFYVAEQSDPAAERWVFGYTVTIENRGSETVQLLRRHWRIVDGAGRRLEVEGEGVIGEQPILRPGESFRYTSGAPLSNASAIMAGSYRMASAAGETFDVRIPSFSLDAPEARGSVH